MARIESAATIHILYTAALHHSTQSYSSIVKWPPVEIANNDREIEYIRRRKRCPPSNHTYKKFKMKSNEKTSIVNIYIVPSTSL